MLSGQIARHDISARHKSRPLQCPPAGQIADVASRGGHLCTRPTDRLEFLSQIRSEPFAPERLGDSHIDIAVRRVVVIEYTARACDLAIQGHQPACLLDRKSTRLNSSHLVISYA